eukprot:7169311-Pyramimonas_sp.AAC.1
MSGLQLRALTSSGTDTFTARGISSRPLRPTQTNSALRYAMYTGCIYPKWRALLAIGAAPLCVREFWCGPPIPGKIVGKALVFSPSSANSRALHEPIAKP